MSQHIEIFAGLAAPFAEDEVRSRRQNGRDFQYITARMVMNRLDEVLGPENWWDDYTPIENAVVCRLTLQLPDGTILTKCDAGGFTTTADTGDYEKSGFSDAFKREAVKFGVGRYLYGDGVPQTIREALARGATDSRQTAPRWREVEPQPQPAVAVSRPAMDVVHSAVAEIREGPLRLGQGTRREAGLRAAAGLERLGQEPGLPRADGPVDQRSG